MFVGFLIFSSWILQKPSLAKGPGKARRLYLWWDAVHMGLASWRHYMEVQVPLNLSCSPMLFLWYTFSKPVLGVPSVGTDTELQLKSEHFLNYECSESSNHWVHSWSAAYLAKVIVKCIKSSRGMCISTPTVLVGSDRYDQHGEPSPITYKDVARFIYPTQCPSGLSGVLILRLWSQK